MLAIRCHFVLGSVWVLFLGLWSGVRVAHADDTCTLLAAPRDIAVPAELADANAGDASRKVDGSDARTPVPCVLWLKPAAEVPLPMLDDAWSKYGELDFEGSLTSASSAVAALLERPLDEEGVARLFDARLLRGLALLALQRETQADESFRDAAVLAPERDLDVARIPPAAVARYDKVRAAVRGAAPVSLRIDSQPSDAALLLDGQAQGRTPKTLAAAPGMHVISLHKDGYPTLHGPLRFDRDAEEQRTLKLEAPTPDTVAAAIRAKGVGVVGTLNADALASLERARIGQVARLEGAGEGYVLEVSPLDAQGVRRETLERPLTVAALTAALEADASDEPLAASGKRKRWWRSPWLWTTVGVVVVAAAATGTYFALREPEPQGRIRIVP